MLVLGRYTLLISQQYTALDSPTLPCLSRAVKLPPPTSPLIEAGSGLMVGRPVSQSGGQS